MLLTLGPTDAVKLMKRGLYNMETRSNVAMQVALNKNDESASLKFLICT